MESDGRSFTDLLLQGEIANNQYQFNSQSSLTPNQPMTQTMHPAIRQVPHTQQINWSQEEDIRLIHSWINVSMDPIIGTDQKAGVFWRRVEENYNHDLPPHIKRRTQKVINSRWLRAKLEVSKFFACVEKITRLNPSGANESDILMMAHRDYVALYGKKFNLEYWWRELREVPCWHSLVVGHENSTQDSPSVQFDASGTCGSGNSRSPTTSPITPKAPTTQTDSIDIDSAAHNPQRPMGRKAAKRLKKVQGDQYTPPPHVVALTDAVQRIAAVREREAEKRILAEQARMYAEEARARADEDKLMMIDTSTISDPGRRRYFEDRIAEIMRRRGYNIV